MRWTGNEIVDADGPLSPVPAPIEAVGGAKLIVPSAVPAVGLIATRPVVALSRLVMATWKVFAACGVVSAGMLIEKVFEVAPAAICTVPVVLVKSVFATAVSPALTCVV